MNKALSPSLRPLSTAGGFTLIEVMVALIVLVLGVLGAAAMTMTALKDSKISGLRTQASAYAYELADLIRSAGSKPPPATISAEAAVYLAAPPTSGVSSCWTTGCTTVQMATNNYYEWNQKVTGAGGLPNAAVKVCRDVGNLTSDATGYATCDGLATSPLVIKMRWDEKSNVARDSAVTGTAAPVSTVYLVVPIRPY